MKLITHSLSFVALVGAGACAEGIEPPLPTDMVSIPANPAFRFGQNPDYVCGSEAGVPGQKLACVEGQKQPVVLPQVTVNVPAFQIDEHEVTNFQYQYCVAKGACSEPEFGNTQTRDVYYDSERFRNFPIVNVTWQQAVDYCKFVGGRLPTEVEWDLVAKGPQGNLLYPSSVIKEADMPEPADCGTADFNALGCGGQGDILEVASTPNDSIVWPGGTIFDMTTNVAEWTDTWYQADVTCATDAGKPCVITPPAVDCATCAAPTDPEAECVEQCNVYQCYGYVESKVFTQAELLPDSGADKSYRGGSAITPKGQMCLFIAGDRSQRNSQVKVQNFLGFRCAK